MHRSEWCEGCPQDKKCGLQTRDTTQDCWQYKEFLKAHVNAHVKEDKPDLPKGYKERNDHLIHRIMPYAKKLLNIVEEFNCTSIEFENDVVKVIIKKGGV